MNKRQNYPYQIGELLQEHDDVNNHNKMLVVIDKDEWGNYFTLLTTEGETMISHGSFLSYPETQ